MKKMLIVCYSVTNGNTRRIAKALQKATGADYVELETVTPYPDDYDALVAQGQREVNKGFKPAIKALDKNVADYDVIAVGTPTWWYTMAPAVATFMSQTKWQGKTVVPFMTNGGWPGHVIKDMTKMAAGAKSVCPIEVKFDSTGGDYLETPQKEIDKWTKSVAEILK